MESSGFEVLDGGNMNRSLKQGNRINKDATIASPTIHRLSLYSRSELIPMVRKRLLSLSQWSGDRG